MAAPTLAALARPFRERYLSYDDLVAQLRAWADAYPTLVRLSTLGKTPEGRDLWCLTLGPDPDRARPTVLIDGNMHATELCGSSVALAIAEDFLRLHVEPDAALHGMPAHVRDRLREVRVLVVPRTCPDGAESVLTTARYCRSNPRDARPNRGHARWIAGDVDGDGLALLMRKVDPTGEFVASTEVPGLMLPRRLEDEGPFYKVWPEGTIENFDGQTVPSPHFLGDNDADLNRNFPWSWAPEPEQIGAGRYPTSEMEARALVELSTAHPEIYAWLNLHTFGGVFIRPLGHAPDAKMDPSDLALYRQIEAWGDELTGYPTVSGHAEFLYEPDKPLHGDLSDFAYHQRGAVSYVVELWDLFARLGIPRKKPFVDHYTHLDRDDLLKLGRWDAAENAGRVIRPWKSAQHPQLGAVEVGGVDGRVGMSNPPYDLLPEVCQKQAAHFLRVAALAPALRIEARAVEALEGDLRRVTVDVENVGYLPTYVLSSARKLPWNEPLWADVATEGCTLDALNEAHREVGHLDGWGRGRFDGESALFYQRSRGSTGRKTLSWVVRGRGRFTVRVGSCRTGVVACAIDL